VVTASPPIRKTTPTAYREKRVADPSFPVVVKLLFFFADLRSRRQSFSPPFPLCYACRLQQKKMEESA
jgi:hypothetical protein